MRKRKTAKIVSKTLKMVSKVPKGLNSPANIASGGQKPFREKVFGFPKAFDKGNKSSNKKF
jgi:hypothetical protein